MAAEISCPECGETEKLQGTRDGEDITVTCGACSHTWLRGLEKHCAKCNDELRPVPKVIAARSRGNQRSIAGTMTVHICPTCDGDIYEQHIRARAPIPPEEWSEGRTDEV